MKLFEMFEKPRQVSEAGDRKTTRQNPLVTVWEGPKSKGYPEQGIIGHMNLSTAASIQGFDASPELAAAIMSAGEGQRVGPVTGREGSVWLEYSKWTEEELAEATSAADSEMEQLAQKLLAIDPDVFSKYGSEYVADIMQKVLTLDGDMDELASDTFQALQNPEEWFGESLEEAGIGKKIKKGAKWLKRGLQGWDNDYSNPTDMVAKHQEYDDETLKGLSDFHTGMKSGEYGHSPRALQQKLIHRNLRKRGHRDFEKYMPEDAPPGMEDWIKDRKPEFKDRYGDKWEEVLYATAWKQHNAKNESIEEADDSMAGNAKYQELVKRYHAGDKSVLDQMAAMRRKQIDKDYPTPFDDEISEAAQTGPTPAQHETMDRLISQGGMLYNKAKLVRGEETAYFGHNGARKFVMYPDGSFESGKEYKEFQRDGWEIEMIFGR